MRKKAILHLIVIVLLILCIGSSERALAETETGYIQGKILDTNHRPIISAYIVVENDGTISKDALDGHFIAGMIPIGIHTFTYRALGYQDQTQVLEIKKDQMTTAPTCLLSVKVHEPSKVGSITGRVVDRAWRPIQSASVGINGTELTTDRNGEFKFTLVYPYIYLIDYEAEGFQFQTQYVEVKAGQVSHMPTVIMSPEVQYEPPKGEISGKIVDENGNPISGATATIHMCTIPTNASGEYRFTQVYSRDYIVHFDAPGYISQFQNVIVSGAPIVLPTVTLQKS